MAITQTRKTAVILRERFRDTLVRRNVLGGLISWYEKQRTDSLGADVFIQTHGDYDRIYIDGERYEKT